MGNKHCHYSYNNSPNDAWNSYTMEDNPFSSSSGGYNRKNYRMFSNNCHKEPSLGELGRSMSRQNSRRASKNCGNSNQPGIFQRLVGTKSSPPSLTEYIPPSNPGLVSFTTPYDQRPRTIGGTAPRMPTEQVRRQREEVKDDDGFERKCQYCNDTVVSQFYNDHLVYCKNNPQNWTSKCEHCGKDVDIYNIENHMMTCEQKVENLKVECEACKEMIPLESHHYHVSTCPCNPQRKRQNRDSIIGLQECAICLQELKKDSEAVFLQCAHQFHAGCIESWAKKKKTCPVCMTDFL